MTWVTRDGHHASGYYQIYREVRGYSAWIKSKRTYGVLGREIASLKAAQAVCEAHREGAQDSEAQPACAPVSASLPRTGG